MLANRQFLDNNFDKLDEMLEPSCHEREVYDITPDDITIVVNDVCCLSVPYKY